MVYEQNEWVRDKLSEIWGDNKADYFVNPQRAPRKTSSDMRIESDFRKNLSNPKNRGSRTGLYAYMIWDNLREDAGSKYKVYSLDKDLNNINYYERVKEKLAEDFIQKKGRNKKGGGYKDVESTKLNNSYADTSRMKKNKVFRSEIELMYRSSKMNEERMNVMRANMPLPDMNDSMGNDSIMRYLPPIMNLNSETKLVKSVNPNLEFITSPIMKKKYKKQLEKNLSRQKDTVLYQMSESKSLANDLANSQLKMEVHNIKLHFLPNRSSREYMVKRNASESNLNETLRSSEGTQSDDMCQLRFEDNKNKLKEIEHHVQEPKPTAQNTALVPYDSKNVSYPPLSMNALMEYKPLIKAPGNGEFDNGKPKLYKLDS